MAYKVKYFMEFQTKTSLANVRVEFHRKDYILNRATRLKGTGEDPLVINYQGEDTLRSAEITLKFVVENHKKQGLKNFWTATEKDWKIFIYVNESIFLESFLLVTDHSTEPMTDDNYILTLKATDGLSLLDAVDFKTVEVYGPFQNTSFPYNEIPAVDIVDNYMNRRYPASELVARALTNTQIGSEILEFVNIYDENMVTNLSSLYQSLIHLEGLKTSGNLVDSRKVLESILDTFCQICFQRNGKWIITSIAELSKVRQKGRRLDMIYGTLIDAFEQSSNEYLNHASKLTRYYFVGANAVQWYVAPMRHIAAKLSYKSSLNLLKNSNFLYYNESDNTWGFWDKVGTISPQRIVDDGYGNVMRFNGDGSTQPTLNHIRSETVTIPAGYNVEIRFRIKREPKRATSFLGITFPLFVRVQIKNDNANYYLIQYEEGTTTVPAKWTTLRGEDLTYKGEILRQAKDKVNVIPQNKWGQHDGFFVLYACKLNPLPNSDKNGDEIDPEQYIEHIITIQDVTILNDKIDSELIVSFAPSNNNVFTDVASVEIRPFSETVQIKGERIELTNDEPSTEPTKTIDLTFQDAQYEHEPHVIINGRANLPTTSWRRLGREEGKSLGELTAEMIFNNAINHRPFFETSFVTRVAPFNYGDVFSYNGMRYLVQDYEYNVLKDEIHGRIIRPIGDCEYNHKAEFWDILKDEGEILVLTKKYEIDSSACADIEEVEPIGAFFEFGLSVDDNLWREAETAGTDIVALPTGQFFEFGLSVDDNLWREAETQGTDIVAVNFGQFFEFGFVVDENLWREAENTGTETIIPYGEFFEFELFAADLNWQEAENDGRNPDFSNEDFSNDFDIVE